MGICVCVRRKYSCQIISVSLILLLGNSDLLKIIEQENDT